MTASRAMIDRRMHDFTQACVRSGIRVTHQRMEIFRAVVSTEEHPDAESVHRRVKKRIPTISLDTVYRNLRLLADHGLISIVGMSQENLRFDGNMLPHHHFACVKCGMIRDFTARTLDNRDIPDAAHAFGTVVSLHVEVKGICSACQRRTQRR